MSPQAPDRVGTGGVAVCAARLVNGPGKAYVRCPACGAVDYERNEGDRCAATLAPVHAAARAKALAKVRRAVAKAMRTIDALATGDGSEAAARDAQLAAERAADRTCLPWSVLTDAAPDLDMLGRRLAAARERGTDARIERRRREAAAAATVGPAVEYVPGVGYVVRKQS